MSYICAVVTVLVLHINSRCDSLIHLCELIEYLDGQLSEESRMLCLGVSGHCPFKPYKVRIKPAMYQQVINK